MASMDYSHHPALNIVLVTPKGDVTVDDINTYGHELIEKGYMTLDTIEYVDMSEITDITFNYRDSHKLIGMHRKWLRAGWYGSFYYAPQDLHMGMVAMVGSVVQSQPNLTLPNNLMLPSKTKLPLEECRDFLRSHRGC